MAESYRTHNVLASASDTLFSASSRSLVFSTVLYIIALYLTKQLWRHFSVQKSRSKKLVNLPVVNLKGKNYEEAEKSYITDMFGCLKAGREKYGDKGYQLWGPEGYLVILPDICVEDLKATDDSFADNAALAQGFIGDYEWINLIRPEIPHTIVTKLTPRMGSLMPSICEEAQYAINSEIPLNADWTSVKIKDAVMRIVCLISGRAFVGLPISREERWIDTSINFAVDLVKAGEKSRDYSYIYRVLAIKLGLIPEVNRMFEWENYAMKRLVPVLRARTEAQARNPNAERPKDMLQYIMEHAAEKKMSFEEQAKIQLVLIMSAIHASSLACTNLVYDLVARPEYIAPLREEIDEVWNSSGTPLDKQSMSKLVKLDSFLKESQRLHPAAHVTFNRKITNKKGFTLSNGLHLPQNTIYAVAASLISRDSRVWDEPDKFKGFRFADMRAESKENANRYQFVTTNPNHSMAFGHGKHACPGRFFAGNEIKVIAAFLLKHYDIKAAPGHEKRPESLEFGINTNVDPNVEILARKRT